MFVDPRGNMQDENKLAVLAKNIVTSLYICLVSTRESTFWTEAAQTSLSFCQLLKNARILLFIFANIFRSLRKCQNKFATLRIWHVFCEH